VIVAFSPSKKNRSRKRLILVLVPILLILAVSSAALLTYLYFAGRQTGPFLHVVAPNIANPGDLVRLEGQNFGNERGLGRVEFDGIPVTTSSYILWTDTRIELRIPAQAGSGLIKVYTDEGVSNPRMFVSQSQLPNLPSGQLVQTIGPVISSLSAEKGMIGSVLTIKGLNFGVNRDSSIVRFSWAAAATVPASSDAGSSEFISPSERDGEYELWSDKEIRVRVPDGAVSGGVSVQTARGISTAHYFELTNIPGQRSLISRRTYAVSHFVSISNIQATEPNAMYVWMANPVESATQRNVQVLDRSHVPLVQNYGGLSIYQVEDLIPGFAFAITQSHVLQSFSLDTLVNPDQIKAAPTPLPALYSLYTNADSMIDPALPGLDAFVRQAVGREKNPYRSAKLLFDALLKRFDYDFDNREDDLAKVLQSNTANGWALVRLYTAALRAVGIPARPVSGVVLEENQRAWNHQWAEFYIYGFGWIPADPVMALGGGNAPFRPAYSDYNRYFGNLDDRRISYSRGVVQVLPMTPNGQISTGLLRYSLQTAMEEVTGDISAYTAMWSDIEITGYY